MCHNFKFQGKQLKYATVEWLIIVADKCVLNRTFYVISKVICERKKREGHLENFVVYYVYK
jgi:hypothetical protein